MHQLTGMADTGQHDRIGVELIRHRSGDGDFRAGCVESRLIERMLPAPIVDHADHASTPLVEDTPSSSG